MTEYVTSVDICNKALQEIGAALITTLNDSSPGAFECNFLYDKTRVTLLREHVWNFSIQYATLSSPTGTNTYQNGLTRNVFTLPAGFMRFADQNPRAAGTLTQSTTGGIKYTDYAIEGGNLTTASAGPIHLRFAGDITNVALMDSLFCDSLAARMNVDGLAEKLTGSVARRQLAEQRYEERIALAKLIGLIEAAGDEPNAGPQLQTARVLERQFIEQQQPQRGRGQ